MHKLARLYHSVVWYKCKSLWLWFVIPYYHKIFIFWCFTAVAVIWQWNWVQFCLFNTCGFYT